MNAAKRSNETRDVTLVEAVNMALHRAMEDDENVVVLGEDIATNGGVFRATVGLKEAFGFKRVMDTPLAENLIAVTVLTNIKTEDLAEVGIGVTPAEQVERLALLARASGMDGVVTPMPTSARS